MGDYLITTDNMTDFPEEYIKEHDLPMMSLTYFLDGVMYTAENSLSSEEFYTEDEGRLYAYDFTGKPGRSERKAPAVFTVE